MDSTVYNAMIEWVEQPASPASRQLSTPEGFNELLSEVFAGESRIPNLAYPKGPRQAACLLVECAREYGRLQNGLLALEWLLRLIGRTTVQNTSLRWIA